MTAISLSVTSATRSKAAADRQDWPSVIVKSADERIPILSIWRFPVPGSGERSTYNHSRGVAEARNILERDPVRISQHVIQHIKVVVRPAASQWKCAQRFPEAPGRRG